MGKFLMTYKDKLTEAMTMLAQQPKTLFVGQSVVYGGQAMHPTFKNVPPHKLIEFPVAEDFQMGYCTGLALEGFLPISVYPRFDFLLLAANQLVNHLDKFKQMSGISPKVIIRTAVGSSSPLNPGPQHTQDYSWPFRAMLDSVSVISLLDSSEIVPAYQYALERDGSTILVEYAEKYNEK